MSKARFRINELYLRSFKNFDDKQFILNKQFTLLVGDNGTGKTAVLDGLAVAIGGYLNSIGDIDTNDKRHIKPEEVRRVQIPIGNTVNLEADYPVKVICKAEIDGEEYCWTRVREKKGRTKYSESDEIKKYIRDMQKKIVNVEESERVILPVFCYHGTGRLWAKTNTPAKYFADATSRFMGYKNCLNPRSNENLFTEWFKETRRIEIDEGIKSVELTAVTEAIETFLGGEKSRIRYNLKAKEIQVTLPDGRFLPFNMLSDGYRNAIGMIADTAFRMIVLNPQLEGKAIKETPGVILIDELDLHLHPKWQMKIIKGLKDTFPSVQIIATTHAPVIISTCENDEIIKLEENSEIEYIKSTYGWLAEDVIKRIMDMKSSRNPEVDSKIDRMKVLYYRKLNENITPKEVEELSKITKELIEVLPSHDPAITLAKLEATKEKLINGDKDA